MPIIRIIAFRISIIGGQRESYLRDGLMQITTKERKQRVLFLIFCKKKLQNSGGKNI